MNRPMEDASKALPEQADIAALSDLELYDASGAKVRFNALFENQKTVVVFIRHFFCGNCQDYVMQLASVRKDALEQADIGLVVIGCGEWQAIEDYEGITGFRGSIYADPTRRAYQALGMTIETLHPAPADQPKRGYVTDNLFMITLKSLWRGPLKRPSMIGKNGNFSQLGGDFILGPGNTCSFAARMQHTQDHTEVSELMEKAGVAYP